MLTGQMADGRLGHWARQQASSHRPGRGRRPGGWRVAASGVPSWPRARPCVAGRRVQNAGPHGRTTAAARPHSGPAAVAARTRGSARLASSLVSLHSVRASAVADSRSRSRQLLSTSLAKHERLPRSSGAPPSAEAPPPSTSC
jgi:hypothetical protein